MLYAGGNPCPPSTSRQAFPAANRSTPIPASQPTPSAQQGLPVANPTQHQASLSSLFSWNPTSLIGRKRKAIGSVRKSQKKRLPTWSHTFVCLASTTQESLPDGQERAALQIAGLGEKRISLNALADAQEIYQDLAFHFPKLCDGGGFELLRLPEGGGKQLDVIASPESGYTVSYLRAVVHHAKIFIRPMQRDLSLEPQKDEVLQLFWYYDCVLLVFLFFFFSCR